MLSFKYLISSLISFKNYNSEKLKPCGRKNLNIKWNETLTVIKHIPSHHDMSEMEKGSSWYKPEEMNTFACNEIVRRKLLGFQCEDMLDSGDYIHSRI